MEIHNWQMTQTSGFSHKVARSGTHAEFRCQETFSGCTNLSSVTFGGSVKIIRRRAFSGCPNLRSVFLPPSVEYVSRGAFNKCTDVKRSSD